MSASENRNHPEAVCLWPCGDWCYLSELSEYGWKSDDYEILPYQSLEWLIHQEINT